MNRIRLFGLLLLSASLLVGCGPDRSVEIPDEPAPMPTMGAETTTASSPAATPTDDTPDTE